MNNICAQPNCSNKVLSKGYCSNHYNHRGEQEERSQLKLVFKNYKEPIKAIPKNKGVGYYGIIMTTENGEYIQCHICGELHRQLSTHLNLHKTTVTEYKEEFGIAFETPLISESMRFERQRQLVKRYEEMSVEEKQELKERMRELAYKNRFNSNKNRPYRLEIKNKRGTCPDQLLDKINEVAEKLGKTPTMREFQREVGGGRYMNPIRRTFGKWNNAIKLSGLKILERDYTKSSNPKYSDEYLIEALAHFYKQTGRPPMSANCGQDGVLPSLSVYKYRFGGITKARAIAGIPQPTSKNLRKNTAHA